jgi:hypothetical protein
MLFPAPASPGAGNNMRHTKTAVESNRRAALLARQKRGAPVAHAKATENDLRRSEDAMPSTKAFLEGKTANLSKRRSGRSIRDKEQAREKGMMAVGFKILPGAGKRQKSEKASS